MTDDEVDDYIRYLWRHLPDAYGHLTVDDVRAVLDAEAVYYERRYGPIRGWRAFLRSLLGRGHPPFEVVEQARPEFEEFVERALAGRSRMTHADIVAIMQAEADAGGQWTPPRPEREGDVSDEQGPFR